MNPDDRGWLIASDEIRQALADRRPVVALESTVISHGLPHPTNIETALACEQAIRDEGAVPATIAILEGIARIGIDADQIERIAGGSSAAGTNSRIEKVGLNNLAAVLARGAHGATTVATSVKLAHAGGIRFFATGGIGGVHRGVEQSLDVSGDLTALASTPVVCVAAGAKSILDLPKTREYLETIGVPVIGYETDEFPAFYCRESGLGVDAKAGSAAEAARIASIHWKTGGVSAVLLCAPIPRGSALTASEVEQAVANATRLAGESGVAGKAITPFVLSQIKELTGGKSLIANRALLVNCATVAARVAIAFAAGVGGER
jgi:pseudouridine-5'-phosphate glycosidase